MSDDNEGNDQYKDSQHLVQNEINADGIIMREISLKVTVLKTITMKPMNMKMITINMIIFEGDHCADKTTGDKMKLMTMKMLMHFCLVQRRPVSGMAELPLPSLPGTYTCIFPNISGLVLIFSITFYIENREQFRKLFHQHC